MNMNATIQHLIDLGTDLGWRLLGALAFWIIGCWLIGIGVGLFSKAVNLKNVDQTMMKYLASAISILLKVILIVSVLGYLGVETTSFAAFLAAIGVAIGAAWGGLLSNLAAGVFLVFLRPFKVGDFISAAGITGTVQEITIFSTAIDTPDNVRTFIGNNRILSDNIQNFTTNSYRRVDLVAQISNGTDHKVAIALLKERLKSIPNVATTPAPDVEIIQFNPSGPLLAVRPYTNNATYWQVYFDTNKLIRESFGEAKFEMPTQPILVKNAA